MECIERSLNALTTNLVVADESRTEKTICLAVSPTMKAYGLPGRARLFEVIQKINEVNRKRQYSAPQYKFTGSSYDSTELAAHPELSVDYIIAPPRMAHYMKYSTRIYKIYLKYIAPEDIHVYSIDEVFMDVTDYLATYHMTPRELAMKMIRDVLDETGITATAGIGTNLYLCKIAMDIVAKHIPADENGVRIAELDEKCYRRMLWDHRPLTDFWRVGPGYAKKLEANYIMTMGDIARCSIKNEDFLYRLFGVNAELLIDHAWGYEPCTIDEIKAYRPAVNSICSGQVLQCATDFRTTRIIIREMADMLALDLLEKGLVTDQLVLTVGYDKENLSDPERLKHYKGEVTVDRYGRKTPKHAHGTINLNRHTSSAKLLISAATELFERISDEALLSRRLNITANHVIHEGDVSEENELVQLDFFSDFSADEAKREAEEKSLEREKSRQKAILSIKNRYGKNAIVKGMNLQEGATAMERNRQIGGHKA